MTNMTNYNGLMIYDVILEPNIDAFKERINKRLKENWLPVGGVAITQGQFFVQAIVFEELY